MSESPVDKVEILVGPFPVDASLMEHNGQRSLLLRPQQTFDSAVRHIRHLLPDVPQEAAERLVREQCPEFKDFDELLGVNPLPMPSVEHPVEPVEAANEPAPPRNARRRRAFLVAALLPALAASWAVGRYTNVVDPTPGDTNASAPDTADGASTQVEKAPFADGKFDYFSASSKIKCDAISTLEAECTDSDGMVMATKAATGPDSTIFTFSYGSERIGLRIFYDAAYAQTWARQDGSRELYPHMKVNGRYVLWGTDPQRIKEYADLLQQAEREADMTAMGGSAPLPPRLAALTLGTLGLDNAQVRQIMARPAVASSDAPVMLAARLVLGLDTAPTWNDGQGGDDIVALAAGLEPSRPVGDANPVGSGPVVVPVTEAVPVPSTPAPSTGTPADGSTGTGTPTTNPSTDTRPPTTPAPDPTPTEPEAPAPEPEQPTTGTPPAEETPPPAEETPKPPVDETPAPPVDETPAPPVEETPAPPATEAPAPAEGQGPADGQLPAPADDAPGQGAGDDDLLIVDSAWTVAA